MPGKILAELEETTAAPTTEPKKVKGDKRRRQKGGDAETTMEEEKEEETPEEVKRAKKTKKRERRQEEEEETQTVPEKSPKKKKKRKSEETEEAQVVEEEVEEEPKKPKSSSKKRKLPPTSPPSPASAKEEEAPLSAASISSTTSSLSGEEVEGGGNAEVLSEEQIAGAFSNFNISDKTITLLRGRGVSYLFPVQCLSLEPIMAGWDLVAQARTGTGKTLAFAIPLVELLRQRHGTGNASKYGRLPQVLVMCPTRELAVQVADDLRAIAAPLRVACFYGGTAYGPQLQQIRSGLDVLVGTPGRLRDLIQNHGLRLRAKHTNEEEDSIKKKKDEEVVEEVEKEEKKGAKKSGGKEDGVRHVVLDEVDQMLDMGFADQVEEILGCIYSKASPENNPQTLLFSATCPPWVFKVAQKFMKETWRRVDLMGTEKTRAATTVQHLAVCCPRSERAVCLGSVLRVYAAGLPGGNGVSPVGSSGGHGVTSVGSSRGRAIVFCETKREAAELALSPAIAQEAQCLHGDVPQQQREACLRAFRSGAVRVLVATDVAARGLDVPEVELVVQCQPPHDVESYIHRSGRTGRAGRTGISICFYEERDAGTLRAIESKAGFVFKRIAVPSANEVLAASTQDVIRSLESVSARVVSRFRVSVEKMLSHRDPWELLSAALSLLAGYEGDDNRSLLTSLKGYTTLILRSSVPLSHSSAAWRALKEELGEQRAEEMVRGMRLLKGKTGVCFDVPENKVEEMKAAWPPSKRWTLEETDERPDLEEINFTAGGGGGGGGG